MSTSAPAHSVTVRKVRGIVTRFRAVCTCGWMSPLTGKDKARIGKQVHEGGGEIVAWEARSKWKRCPDCHGEGDARNSEDEVRCYTCNGSGKVLAEHIQ